MGQEEVERREAYKNLQVAAKALVDAEAGDAKLAIALGQGLRDLAVSLKTPVPVTVNNIVPEVKQAPPVIQFSPLIEVAAQPAPEVHITNVIPEAIEETEVLRDKQGRMIGTRKKRIAVAHDQPA